MDDSSLKKLVGYKAAQYVRPNMIVGIGTGSTVRFFIEKLGIRIKEGLSIKGVCSSKDSERLSMEVNIPLLTNQEVDHIDLTVDGADEINPAFQMIKGGGGALFREKLLAIHSKKMIVIIDHTKWVAYLGNKKIPIEILPFCFPLTIKEIEKKGLKGNLRKTEQGDTYVTDNGNYIFDLSPIQGLDPKPLHTKLIQIPGVVETGIFFDVATKILMSYPDGRIIEKDI
jgi:ribose 5-phosphate isomerase A